MELAGSSLKLGWILVGKRMDGYLVREWSKDAAEMEED